MIPNESDARGGALGGGWWYPYGHYTDANLNGVWDTRENVLNGGFARLHAIPFVENSAIVRTEMKIRQYTA